MRMIRLNNLHMFHKRTILSGFILSSSAWYFIPSCGNTFGSHGCAVDKKELANLESRCVEGNCENGFGRWEGSQIQFTYCEDLVNGCWCEGMKAVKIEGYHYSGSWKNGKKNGAGEWNIPDGSKYVGDFLDDDKHGFGKYYDKSGKLWFEGRYEHDSPLLDGQCIEGNCIDGYGTKTWRGSTYKGYFKHGLRHGFGIHTTMNGQHVYRGDWENDFENGYGIDLIGAEVRYAGQWKNDKRKN